MPNNQKPKLRIIQNENLKPQNSTCDYKNEEIENIIISAAKLSQNSEVKVFFKNIPASEYNLGYKKFCGTKINNLVFYNPSLFNLYPKLIDFLSVEYNLKLINSINLLYLNNYHFSNSKNHFKKSKNILNTNIYMNLDLDFDEIIQILDNITEYIFENKVLKILEISSIKN